MIANNNIISKTKVIISLDFLFPFLSSELFRGSFFTFNKCFIEKLIATTIPMINNTITIIIAKTDNIFFSFLF